MACVERPFPQRANDGKGQGLELNFFKFVATKESFKSRQQEPAVGISY